MEIISSKILTDTDAEKRLSMETRSLEHLPRFPPDQNFQTLNVEDEEGNMWCFRLIIRRGRYRKPVLSAGWLRFVREKGIRRGFKVKFLKEQDEVTGDIKLKIRVKKPIVVFNTVLGYVPHRVR